MRTTTECYIILENFGFDYDQIKGLYTHNKETFDIQRMTDIVLTCNRSFGELRHEWYDNVFPSEDTADIYWVKFVNILLDIDDEEECFFEEGDVDVI